MENLYKAIVINEKTGKEASAIDKKLWLKYLLAGQNHLADVCNPMYDEWNTRFDRLYPDDDEDRFDPDSKYMSFIRRKQNRMLDGFKCGPSFIKYYTNKECDIAIKTPVGNFSLNLKPFKWGP